jgi:hypothetical protein
VERDAQYPDSFDIPSVEEKADIAPGDKVEAMFEMKDGWGERMWLEVVEIKRRHLVCRLVNHPVGIPRLSSGDTIEVKRDHVIDISWHEVEHADVCEERPRALPSHRTLAQGVLSVPHVRL